MAPEIDADAADEQVCRWLREQAAAAALARGADGDQGLVGVAVDGKTVRNTVAPGGPEGSAVKLFSAMPHREAVVIAQLRVPEGANEITQIAAALPSAAPGSAHHVEEDRSKGRIVRRQIWTTPADGVAFPGAAQAFRIRRDTFDHEGTRLSKEVVHGITSLATDQAGPEVIAQFVRRHWGIENKIHWVRDVVYREDTPTPEQAPRSWPPSLTFPWVWSGGVCADH